MFIAFNDPGDLPNTGADDAPTSADDAAIIDGMDAAFESDELPAAPAPKADEGKGDEPAPDSLEPDAGADGKPPADEKPGDAGKDGKPDDKPKDGEEPKPPEKDEATEKEIADRGLKGDTAERFREMAGKIRDMAPMKEALEAAGVKSLDDVPLLVKRAEGFDGLTKMIQDTGADSEQFGKTLGYLEVINLAARGDKAAGERAWEMYMSEGRELAALLGKELPGVHDPLEAHADLKEEVEKGDLTRARAIEMAQARASESRRAEAERAQAEQAAQQDARAQGIASINALDKNWIASDPHYSVKRPILGQMVAEIKAAYPASEWAAKTQRAYESLAALQSQPAAAPPVEKPPAGGRRPTGPRAGEPTPGNFKTPEDALDYALDPANFSG